jgi:hypothetical protein
MKLLVFFDLLNRIILRNIINNGCSVENIFCVFCRDQIDVKDRGFKDMEFEFPKEHKE